MHKVVWYCQEIQWGNGELILMGYNLTLASERLRETGCTTVWSYKAELYTQHDTLMCLMLYMS